MNHRWGVLVAMMLGGCRSSEAPPPPNVEGTAPEATVAPEPPPPPIPGHGPTDDPAQAPCAAGQRVHFACDLADARRVILCATPDFAAGAGGLQLKLAFPGGGPPVAYPYAPSREGFSIPERVGASGVPVVRFDSPGAWFELTAPGDAVVGDAAGLVESAAGGQVAARCVGAPIVDLKPLVRALGGG